MSRYWEHMNSFVMQLPVFTILIARCLIRGFSPMVLLKANHGLKNGGVGLVSKYFDFKQFDNDYFLDYIFLKKNMLTKTKISKIESFSKYPVVVKPDNGRTGKGVFIADNREELKNYLSKSNLDLIAQIYSSKKEYGVFYYRLKGVGHIYSINSKEMPYVRGTGNLTVAQLIEKDHMHIKDLIPSNIDQSYTPKKGEKVKVSYIGNHSHGAIFRDVSHISSKKLLVALENAISKAGFNYGRFDVFAKDDKALSDGKIKIIEVNGVHSFSTNYLDPKYSLFDAYKIIYGQYDLLLKVALENKNKNMKNSSLLKFIKSTFKSESSIDRLNVNIRS